MAIGPRRRLGGSPRRLNPFRHRIPALVRARKVEKISVSLNA